MALFAQIWAKIKFPWKNELCWFINMLIIYHGAKNLKKTNEPFLRKIPD